MNLILNLDLAWEGAVVDSEARLQILGNDFFNSSCLEFLGNRLKINPLEIL
jgi:hypothetical protein